MAQSAVFEPPGPFHLNVDDGHPHTRSQDLASVLKHVVTDQNGNDNPSHHTVLLLMELRANLENRHDSPDACQEPESESAIWAVDEAMHLSLEFLQSMTDLNGNFRPLVTSCLDLAAQIIHAVDTSEMGDPDAVTLIKQLRKLQTVDMYHIRERWEDLLQAADDNDESATFERLSEIMEYTEDEVNDKWREAKSFISSCEEQIRYRLDDTFLPSIYASSLTLPPPTNREIQTLPREKPELAVLHHPVAPLSNNMATTCATIANYNASLRPTPTSEIVPDRHSPMPTDEATVVPKMDPKRGGTTPVYDSGNVQRQTPGPGPDNFPTTLIAQTQRVDDVIAKIMKQVEDRTLLTEVKTLATISGESAERAARLLQGQPTLTTGPVIYERGDAPPTNEKTQSNRRTTPNNQSGTEIEKNIKRHTETAPTYSINERNRPIFIPIDRSWYYLGARDTPLVRQAEAMQRPPGVYIGPFTSPPPIEKATDLNEDHNWRRKEERQYRTEVAISEGNWPKSRAERKHDEYINKQHHHRESVADKTSKGIDGLEFSDMDSNTRRRFEAIHIPEWIEIRGIPDEEHPRPYRGPGVFEAPWRSRQNQSAPTASASDDIRRVTTTPTRTNRALGIRPPRHSDVLGTSHDEDSAQYPPPIKDETLEEMRRTPYPTAARAISRESPPQRAETPPEPEPLRNITNTEGQGSRQNPPRMIVRANPGRSSSSSPEAIRPLRDPFRDILDDEPVLPTNNPRTRDESDNSQDDASIVAALVEYGRSIREENARRRSTDSSESPTDDIARPTRPRIRGIARPRSYLLRDEAYVGPTDLRNMRQSTDHACQECKGGSRCWCPIRGGLPGNNGRTPSSRQYGRCRSCRKMWVVVGNSRQWCCEGWILPGTPHTSPER